MIADRKKHKKTTKSQKTNLEAKLVLVRAPSPKVDFFLRFSKKKRDMLMRLGALMKQMDSMMQPWLAQIKLFIIPDQDVYTSETDGEPHIKKPSISMALVETAYSYYLVRGRFIEPASGVKKALAMPEVIVYGNPSDDNEWRVEGPFVAYISLEPIDLRGGKKPEYVNDKSLVEIDNDIAKKYQEFCSETGRDEELCHCVSASDISNKIHR